MRNDAELNKFLASVTIAKGGVLPNIQAKHAVSEGTKAVTK